MLSYLLEEIGTIMLIIVRFGMILLTFATLCIFFAYLVFNFRTSAKVRNAIIAVCVTSLIVFIIVKENVDITIELITGALCFIYVIIRCISMFLNGIIEELNYNNKKKRKNRKKKKKHKN